MTRIILSSAVVALIGGCVAVEIAAPPPLLVWNVTASAPLGLYRRFSGAVRKQDWVLARPSGSAAKLAAERGYLPENVALIKRIAALSGDQVCRIGSTVSINGRVAALAHSHDAKGRKLPVWSGCITLGADQYFLLTPASASFDSRYFGPVPRANVLERIAPLWTS